MVLPLISLCIIFRIRQSCILRIYQSRMNPTDFLAVAPRLVVGNRTVRFTQGDAEALTHEGDRSAMANIFMGNLKIKRSRFLSDNDLYRANFFRGCMLNELAARPPPETL
uniref:Uncharacterized protein n=1 Tax=Plectus sambesii TaxID=2011161 RepID=A0A914UW53_9BILA